MLEISKQLNWLIYDYNTYEKPNNESLKRIGSKTTWIYDERLLTPDT